MKLVFLKSFEKDIVKLNNTSVKAKLKEVILELKEVSSIRKIQNCSKLKGHTTAYRIRIGDYRLGIYIKENTIHLARFVKRNDIYKLFP